MGKDNRFSDQPESVERNQFRQGFGDEDEPKERPDEEAVKQEQQDELAAERDYHNRRSAGDLTDEEKANTVLSDDHQQGVLNPTPEHQAPQTSE